MEPLRVGVVGLNERVERQVLPALASSPRARLTAVCSRDFAKAERFAAPYPDCRPFADFHDFVQSDRLDAVFVLTPAEQHADMSLAAIEAGRHVCCEKPLATSLADASNMAAAARSRGVRTAVNFTYRSSTALRTLERALAHPGVGERLHIEIAYLQGRALLRQQRPTSVLFELGSHAVDALLWWGARPVAAQALAPHGHEGPTWTIALEDADGRTALVQANKAALGHRNAILARIYGRAGALRLEFDTERFSLTHYSAAEPSVETAIEPDPDLRLTFQEFPRFHFDRIVGALRGEEAFPDFAQGARVQAVLGAAIEASLEGRRVPIALD